MTLSVASLIPSGTEIVSALGLADTLVGRSHACDYPSEVLDLPVLSRPKVDPESKGAEIDEVVRSLMSSGESVYEILMDRLLEAAPDVVITQDHCDACAVSLEDVRQAVACADLAGARLCALHPHDLDGIREDFDRVAEALGVRERGSRLRSRFDERLDAVRRRNDGGQLLRVVLVEWLDPPMVAGGWMPELARIAGLEPLIVSDATSFEQVSWSDITHARPDAVVLLPCGFSVPRTLRELRTGEAGRAVSEMAATIPLGVRAVDGDALFNRPGPRLADSAELLSAVLRPERADELRAFEGSYSCIDGERLQRTISVPSSSE